MDALHVPGPLERRFGAALIVSLAAHAAALVVSVPAPRVALFEPPAVLQVALPQLPVPTAASPEPDSLAAPAPLRDRRSQPALRKHEPRPLAREVEPPAPAPARDVYDEPSRAAPAAPEPSLAAPAAPPQPAVALQAPLPHVPSSNLLSDYGQAISQALARHKEYPRIAQMQGWQGAVTMRLRVAPSGRLLDAEVHTSSGYEVLDRQALAMASKAGLLPAPPEGLRDREIAVLVPVVFRLGR